MSEHRTGYGGSGPDEQQRRHRGPLEGPHSPSAATVTSRLSIANSRSCRSRTASRRRRDALADAGDRATIGAACDGLTIGVRRSIGRNYARPTKPMAVIRVHPPPDGNGQHHLERHARAAARQPEHTGGTVMKTAVLVSSLRGVSMGMQRNVASRQPYVRDRAGAEGKALFGCLTC